MAKDKNNKIVMYLGIIALVVLCLGFLGIADLSKLSVTGDGTKAIDTSGAVPQTCSNSATSTAITFTVLDEFGNNVTSDYNVWYKVNGSEQAVKAASAGFTASPGQAIDYVMTGAAASHDVYAFSGNFTVVCATTQPITVSKGMQDTTLSLTAYDVAGGSDSVNTASNAATIGAGGTLKAKVFASAAVNDGVWSTSESGREVGVAIDYNSLVYKQPVLTSTDKGTLELMGSIPNGHTQVTGTNATVFYTIKADALKDLGDLTIRFQAEALTGTTNPSVSDGNVFVSFYDKELYQRADGSRSWATGFRNADTAADLAESNATITFYAN
jgi:hypothetical protein